MIVFLLLLSTICLSLAAHWEGDMSSSKDFVFMDRFAFVETGKHPQIQDQGLWSFTISKSKLDNAAKQEDVQIDLYYDSEKSWFKVYDNDDLTCWQKRSLAAPLHNTTRHSNTSHVWFDIPENIYITDSQAPHFWYIAISNCKAGENEWSVAYNMSATNPGGWWFRQFSVDQQRLLGMRFTFTWFLFLPLLVVNIVFSIKLQSQGSYSLANKAISLFVLLETLDSLFQFMHLAAYAGNGSGLPFFRVLGDLVEQTSQVLITLTLLALAQGWCVTSVTLRDRKIMQGLAVGVALTYLILVIWQLGGESRESTLYYYESFPGVLALLVRIALWAYFAMSLRMTWREETNPKTRNFYVVFGGLFSLWFLILVFIVLIAAATPPVYRERTVETMYTLLNYCAAVVLTLLFAPPIADRFFDLGNAKTSLLSSDAPTGSYQAL